MANVKVFWRTDGQTDGQTDRQTDRVITTGHPPSGGALITPRENSHAYSNSSVSAMFTKFEQTSHEL